MSHYLTTEAVMAVPDAELVRRSFDRIDAVVDHAPTLADELLFLVGEMLERFAPEVARADLLRRHAGEPDDLLDALREFESRQAARQALN